MTGCFGSRAENIAKTARKDEKKPGGRYREKRHVAKKSFTASGGAFLVAGSGSRCPCFRDLGSNLGSGRQHNPGPISSIPFHTAGPSTEPETLLMRELQLPGVAVWAPTCSCPAVTYGGVSLPSPTDGQLNTHRKQPISITNPISPDPPLHRRIISNASHSRGCCPQYHRLHRPSHPPLSLRSLRPFCQGH